MSELLRLNEDEVAVLLEQDPATELDGGYQRLMVRLQRKLDRSTGHLELDARDLEQIQRYASAYGQGGWQERLHAVFARHLGPDLSGRP